YTLIMKSLFKKIILSSIFFSLISFPAFAQIKGQITSPLKVGSVADVLVAFFNFLLQLGAVAVTLAIVYAGFLFVVARGNPEQLNKARTTLFWTIIGAL